MLRVSRKPYMGQYRIKAEALVKQGVRVGMMWRGNEAMVHCHVCDKQFEPPTLDPKTNDAWGECTHCHTPFIFAEA